MSRAIEGGGTPLRERVSTRGEFVEEAIRREYHKMVKKGTITDVPGQMSLDDFE